MPLIINKVILKETGTTVSKTLIDLSSTTAEAGEVLKGKKYFSSGGAETFGQLDLKSYETKNTNAKFESNGVYTPPSGYTGFWQVSVETPEIKNTPPTVITVNSAYTIPSGYTGHGEFTVNVPQNLVKNFNTTFTSNSVYQIPQGYTGYGVVTVNVPSTPIVNKDITFTSNSVYTVPTGYTGYGTITVNVPESGNSVKTISSEAEMDTALASSSVGQIYKYVGTTGRYEQNSYYVVE